MKACEVLTRRFRAYALPFLPMATTEYLLTSRLYDISRKLNAYIHYKKKTENQQQL